MKKTVLALLFAMFVSLTMTAQSKYDPEKFALPANRGSLRSEYFGVKLDELEKDSNGLYKLTDAQLDTIKVHILGEHPCSLQWISWKEFGTVTFSETEDGKIKALGEQRKKGDYLTIDGYVTIVSPLHIRIKGKIVTRVSHINNGKPVVREGTYNFKISGARKYWRMQEIGNPKEEVADYVDIYFE